jgi:hypothetical protein
LETVSVPLIRNPCTVQWYGKAPRVVNVMRKESPAASTPVLTVVPLSEVAECVVVVSLFVQQTVVPGVTVSDPGEYERPGPIETIASPGWQVTSAPGAAMGAPPARPSSDSSAMVSARPIARHTRRRSSRFSGGRNSRRGA